MKNKGICHITGAGPGDIGLVTLRARQRIEQAEVIVYDYLCNPAMLAWAPAGAEVIYAGKRAGNHAMKQEEINALLVEKVRAGKRVVRLKGGDPFVFGRGGEEAEALAEAGLEFEVVPGVSSAFAAAAYAGIPLTHREHASQVTIFTGHEDPAKAAGALDYAQLAQQPGTKVMLMGMERLAEIAARMVAGGAKEETPVALVRWATTGQQQTLVGTLRDIAARAAEADFRAPAVAIIGDVVRLREQLNWFESRPLLGKRIVVTRTRRQAGALSGALAELGADVIELPTIRIEPPEDLLEFGQLVQDSHQYDWIIFTSVNGVNAFFEMFYKLYDDARDIGPAKIVAVGPSTAQRVRDFHLKVDLQPAEYVAESIIRALQGEGSIENTKMLLVRPEASRDLLAPELSKLGVILDEAVAYRTTPEAADAGGAAARLADEGADLITFTSSSTVENFLALKLQLPRPAKFASIGPITSQTLRDRGLQADVEAKKHDIPGLIAAITKFYS